MMSTLPNGLLAAALPGTASAARLPSAQQNRSRSTLAWMPGTCPAFDHCQNVQAPHGGRRPDDRGVVGPPRQVEAAPRERGRRAELVLPEVVPGVEHRRASGEALHLVQPRLRPRDEVRRPETTRVLEVEDRWEVGPGSHRARDRDEEPRLRERAVERERRTRRSGTRTGTAPRHRTRPSRRRSTGCGRSCRPSP